MVKHRNTKIHKSTYGYVKIQINAQTPFILLLVLKTNKNDKVHLVSSNGNKLYLSAALVIAVTLDVHNAVEVAVTQVDIHQYTISQTVHLNNPLFNCRQYYSKEK